MDGYGQHVVNTCQKDEGGTLLATHTSYISKVLCSNALVVKFFDSSKKAEIVIVKLKPRFLLKV